MTRGRASAVHCHTGRARAGCSRRSDSRPPRSSPAPRRATRRAGVRPQRGIRVTEYYGAAELSFVAVSDVTERLEPSPASRSSCAAASAAATRSGRVRRTSRSATSSAAAVLRRRDDSGFASVGDLIEHRRRRRAGARPRRMPRSRPPGAPCSREDIERAIKAHPRRRHRRRAGRTARDPRRERARRARAHSRRR